MTSLPEPNEGDRPSRLQLARLATGELEGAERDAVEAWVAANGSAWLDALSAAEAPPLDLDDLRARARRDLVVPPPANRPLWKLLAPLLVAAAAGLALLPRLWAEPPVEPTPLADARIRGGGLVLHELRGGALVPWSGGALAEGDVVGFAVHGGLHRSVVVLSIDGTGRASVYADGVTLDGSGAIRLLDGSVTLDGAPGPELFVAAFDRDATDVVTEIERAFRSGGAEGVRAWADARPDVDVVAAERR